MFHLSEDDSDRRRLSASVRPAIVPKDRGK